MSTWLLSLLLAVSPGACTWSASPDGAVYPYGGALGCYATIIWPSAGLKTVCLAKVGYLTHCEGILVTDPVIFKDGFESGNIQAWSNG